MAIFARIDIKRRTTSLPLSAKHKSRQPNPRNPCQPQQASSKACHLPRFSTGRRTPGDFGDSWVRTRQHFTQPSPLVNEPEMPMKMS
jgi:hypothetical protein